MKTPARNGRAPGAIRCAIYTRKSTDEGLEKEFNSLDAQRESAEAYIRSQQHEGWVALPGAYEDGGYTGGNMERPALRRLLADIEAGKVDLVAVYKIDRLSRSLLDFGRIMELFDKHHVAFVSVTQQFNTNTSMGRLMMNVLLSFAQFEREIISERTRDKIRAARRKGKHSGGRPILGYDISAERNKLLVNEPEAERVRAIYALYIEMMSLSSVVEELQRRGWCNKRWVTNSGGTCGGLPFNRANLHRLLTNVLYIGQVRYKDEVHPGEHIGIVPRELWDKVQAILQQNNLNGGLQVRSKFGALLRGLIFCKYCGCAMTPGRTKPKGRKTYRYYVCSKASKEGWAKCPSKSVPAGEMERVVVQRIRAIGKEERLIHLTLEQARLQAEEQRSTLLREQRILDRDLQDWHEEVLSLTKNDHLDSSVKLHRLADYQERIRVAESRFASIRTELAALEREAIQEGEVRQALAEFDLVWQALASHEQASLVQRLIQRIEYDGRNEKASISFRNNGIVSLAIGLGQNREEHQ